MPSRKPKTQEARDKARFEDVLHGRSELGFGDRAVAEAKRLAMKLVEDYNEVVFITDAQLEHLRNPRRKGRR